MFRFDQQEGEELICSFNRIALLLALLGTLAAGSASAGDVLALRLQPGKASYRLGEPIRLTWTLKNASSKPLLVGDPGTTPRPTVPPEDWGIMLKVTGPEGQAWEIERTDEYAAMVHVKRSFFRDLAPGGALQGSLKLGDRRDPIEGLTRWVLYHPGRSSIGEEEMNVLSGVFGRPGVYQVAAVYTNRVDQCWEDGKLVSIKPWLGAVNSPAVEIRIVP